MTKQMICILCPNGCELEVEYGENRLLSVCGNKCPKGALYAEQEVTNPTRNIATSVLVIGGELPLCSVRLTKPIPKSRIFDAVNEIQKIRLNAPVSIGQVLLRDILGLGSDVIATRPVEKQ